MGKRILMILIVIAIGWLHVAMAAQYPARCRVTTNLNVRSSPSKNGSKLGIIPQGNYITVNYVTGSSTDSWGAIDYGSKRGYVSMRYVHYVAAASPPPSAQPRAKAQSRKKSGFVSFLEGVWTVIKWILGILVVLLVLAFWEYIIELAVYAGMFAGAGAIIFAICGGSGGTGAIVGLVVAGLVGVRIILGKLDLDFDFGGIELGGFFRGLFIVCYYAVSSPIYFLNRIEHALVSPWRYFFKKNWAYDGSKPAWRVATEVITVVMCIVTTPLRLTNAIIYNIFIHCVTGIYDLLLEVLSPSDDSEGADNVWKWIYMLPWRMLKYVFWHGALLVVESVIWTVVDIFIPARTYYHGTTLGAGNAITSDPYRNRYLKDTSRWTSGTFLASSDPDCSWAGRGVYFAIQRGLAMAYSGDNRSGRGGDPVMIACRVSMGRMISYTLMPDWVYNQAGGGGNHDEINKFADAHGYTAGEWYNYRGVWEYCLFDWQNRYNHPWRIRPIYVLNLRTGLAQHITGGMQHWLFDKDVLDDLL